MDCFFLLANNTLKGFQCWPTLGTHGRSSEGSSAFYTYCGLYRTWSWGSHMTFHSWAISLCGHPQDPCRCCRVLGTGMATTCFSGLGLWRPGVKHRSPVSEALFVGVAIHTSDTTIILEDLWKKLNGVDLWMIHVKYIRWSIDWTIYKGPLERR